MYENEPGIRIAGYPLTGIIRQVRRRADLSQRELARFAHLSPGAVGAIESGKLTPSVPTLQRLLNAANCQLVVVDGSGRLVVPLLVWGTVADLAGRRLPAHLDTILDPEPGEWWADGYGLARPPETFRRNRRTRDWERVKSRRDVRDHGAARCPAVRRAWHRARSGCRTSRNPVTGARELPQWIRSRSASVTAESCCGVSGAPPWCTDTIRPVVESSDHEHPDSDVTPIEVCPHRIEPPCGPGG